MKQENDSKDKEIKQTEYPGLFTEYLVWKEGPNAKWFLESRECISVDKPVESETEIFTFDMTEYNHEQQSDHKIEQGNMTISSLGQFPVDRIEDNNAYITIAGEETAIELEQLKKFIKLNFYIIGKTKTEVLKDIEVNINHTVEKVKEILSEYLSLTKEVLILYKNSNELENTTLIHELNLNDGEFLSISFPPSKEICFKRSTCKDYTWNDAKNYIPFKVDKDILVTGFGFFRSYDNTPAVYDFSLYETSDMGHKIPIAALLSVKVLSSEVDSIYVKKVSLSPIMLKANVIYHAYVYYKLPNMQTYYASSGSEEVSIEGVRFKMLNLVEPEHRSNSTSGHLPYIFFKLYNPYAL